MSRRRRRRGPGRRRPRRTILITSVAPTGDVNVYSPTIQAYVEDRNGSPLSRHDIDVYVDGNETRFNYGRSSGSLRCSPGRLSSGTHTVEIEASSDNAVGRKRWTFNVKK